MTPAQIEAARPYRDVTERELPWLVEELDAVADGAGADRMAVFAAGIEELDGEGEGEGACSDMVARPPASVDGHLWVAHNNDLSPGVEPDIVATEWRIPGDPVVFTIGIGPWISVGFNSAGLALTGNEVSPNDNRIGIPRSCTCATSCAGGRSTRRSRRRCSPHRASSYNTILSHRDGGVVNVEGSATDAELIRPGPEGHPGPHESLRERPDAPV